ncbi:hypothetical protein DENSPDRAFT_746249, partial [Dentipellis sp. KUC8613]
LPGLEESVIPVEPNSRSFKIQVKQSQNKHVGRTIHCRQFPVTAAYAFTDYHSQGQTIPTVVVDLATPPSGGGLNLFSLYVALSRSSGRQTIRLLRPFDEKLFMASHNADLLQEDDRLDALDHATKVAYLQE